METRTQVFYCTSEYHTMCSTMATAKRDYLSFSNNETSGQKYKCSITCAVFKCSVVVVVVVVCLFQQLPSFVKNK